MQIELKRVDSEKEIGVLCKIAATVWHETYDPLLPPGQTDYMIEKFQSPEAVKAQMKDVGYEYYLIACDGTAAGFVGFAPRYEDEHEMFLSKVYLLSEFRGKGAIRKGLELVEAESKKQGLSFIRLTVNKHNTHAITVYQHMGYVISDSVVSDIGNGYVMDDYIMVKQLS